MTYKECLLFIGKCLTLSLEKTHFEEIKNCIQNENFDWDSVVKLSTEHYVFPALYLNLQRTSLLSFVPQELVNYMEHITQLNRDRNKEIVKQVKEINQLLTKNGIRPIFLKGAALLTQNIFQDIGERMIGDIDFLVAPNEAQKAYEVLCKNGYSKVHDTTYDHPNFKHLPRIQKEENIAAIEVHWKMTVEGYSEVFNYELVSKDILDIKGINFLSYINQLRLAIIAKEINDDGQFYYSMSLRNGYDVFTLCYKTDSLKILDGLGKLYHPLNNFLAVCHLTFDSKKIQFENTEESKNHLQTFNALLKDDFKRKNHRKRIDKKLFINKRLNIIVKSFTRKDHRTWIWNRVRDKEWQQEKLVQLGFKSKSSAH